MKEVADKDFGGHIDIVAQNIKTQDFGDPVFKPYVMRVVGGQGTSRTSMLAAFASMIMCSVPSPPGKATTRSGLPTSIIR